MKIIIECLIIFVITFISVISLKVTTNPYELKYVLRVLESKYER